ncbi:MAG: hypothetical protein R3E66_19340 [bacterium]
MTQKNTDQKIVQAIEALHARGPKLVCELWDELEQLRAQAPRRRRRADTAKALVDRLRATAS